MKNIFTVLLIGVPFLLNAQSSTSQRVSITIGKSLHGTGDLTGVKFTTEYSKHFTKILSCVAGVGATIHDGQRPLFYEENGYTSCRSCAVFFAE